MKRKRIERARFAELLRFEKRLSGKFWREAAGVDEAGRGPLAGPVVAASVVLGKDFYLPGLDDSKRLSEKTRERCFDEIIRQAVSVSWAVIDNGVIDRVNILRATWMAMEEALLGLSIVPSLALIDGREVPGLRFKQKAVIQGDRKSVSIAAASVVAKVVRDRLMTRYHEKFPLYGFDRNKGYGTKEHVSALGIHGPCEIHRMSFAPVRHAEVVLPLPLGRGSG
ncbi:MAG: ribonuclease HII [Candidatus Eisenbacteria bacterium]|nr:ribonuclease HII [Candidatus Eisenbacteria bacterium]